jgi:thioredoxin 1
MAASLELNKDNFASEVENAKGAVMVDFFAEWCAPCRIVEPIVEQIAGEYEGKVKVCRVDVDKNREIAAKYDIMSIPTMIFFKDGEVKDTVLGAVPKEQLTEKLDALL